MSEHIQQIISISTENLSVSVPTVQAFFDEQSNTFSYVVSDPVTGQCAIIDSVLNYDAAAVRTTTTLADHIITYIEQEHLQVEWILETHVHADHLSAAQYLKSKLGGKVAIGQQIETVQEVFSKIYDIDGDKLIQQQPFDYLFKADEVLHIGQLRGQIIATPGHTPACVSYVIGDAVFVGDTLFMHDYGTARCDFPQGDAAQLFDSVQRLYCLPDEYRMFLCHDYLPKDRSEYQCETSIGVQKAKNTHIKFDSDKQTFIEMRNKRDAKLSLPKLMLPAIQINMKAGHMPEPNAKGQRYLKLPLNYF